MGERPYDPATEAVQALRLAERARRGGRMLAIARPMTRPFFAWGVAWILDGVAFRALPLPYAVAIASCLGVAALLIAILGRSQAVRSPWGRAAGRCWWVLLLGSAALCALLNSAGVDPARLVLVMVVLWGVGILLYGVAAEDRGLFLLGAVLVLLPVPSGLLLSGPDGVLVTGAAGGAAMLGVGAWNATRRA